MKKKMILALAAVALVGVMAVGGTLAYFTDSDSADNVFTMGKVEADLTEPSWEEKQFNPGDFIAKDPTVTIASDSLDSYVRFQVVTSTEVPEIADKLSELVFCKAVPANESVETEKIVYTETSENGTVTNYVEVPVYKDGGYFVVEDAKNPTVLKAGESYTLFDHVLIPKTWGNEFAGKKFVVSIKAEVVQADNFDVDDWDIAFPSTNN